MSVMNRLDCALRSGIEEALVSEGIMTRKQAEAFCFPPGKLGSKCDPMDKALATLFTGLGNTLKYTPKKRK